MQLASVSKLLTCSAEPALDESYREYVLHGS